ncbi:MAG: lipopolysaccharide biosynthesis protein [Allosphingosinicella sp.]|uniref:lipopolysaccharide biosynthesis protein n=1 Tax=Allosphingosinicella sp. TaxID=2823234 RepID=UPI00394D43DA
MDRGVNGSLARAADLISRNRRLIRLIGVLGGIRAAHAVGGIVLVAVVVRGWSLTDAGVYFLFVTVSAMAGALLLGALQHLSLRHGSIYREKGDDAGRLRLFGFGWAVALLLYVVLKGLLAAVGTGGAGLPEAATRLLATGLLAESITLSGLILFMVGYARSGGHLTAAQLPEFVFRTWGMVLLAAAVLALPGAHDAVSLPQLFVAVQIVSLLFLLAVSRAFVSFVKLRPSTIRPERGWVAEYPRLAFYTGSGAVLASMDVILVGLLLSVEDAAIYKVAAQAGAIIISGIQLSNVIYAPQMAVLHDKGERDQLQRVTRHSARISFLISLAVVALFAVSQPVLPTIFGSEFGAAYVPLMILAAGRLVNAWYGSATNLAIMSGTSILIVWAQLLGIVVAALLIGLLAPAGGVAGVAMAMSVSLVVWNVVLARALHRKLKVKLGAF